MLMESALAPTATGKPGAGPGAAKVLVAYSEQDDSIRETLWATHPEGVAPWRIRASACYSLCFWGCLAAASQVRRCPRIKLTAQPKWRPRWILTWRTFQLRSRIGRGGQCCLMA